MTLTRVELNQFTAFTHLELDLSPGINVLVGANGTGKTHLMKVCYAACDVSKSGVPFAEKLVRVMLPSGRAPGRLVNRGRGKRAGLVAVHRGDMKLTAILSSPASRPVAEMSAEAERWSSKPMESVYIPVKEMLANAPGFRSLYAGREIHFEEVYNDILDRAYLPRLRGPIPASREKLLARLRDAIGGSVTVSNEEFFLSNGSGNLEFTLLAEGIRKLGLLWLLIQNGVLRESSALFWDEPEANMNPTLIRALMDFILELQRNGAQVFIATHNYVVLKELDLLTEDGDDVMYHSLSQDAEFGGVVCNSAPSFHGIHPDLIGDTFTDLYDREISRSLGRLA